MFAEPYESVPLEKLQEDIVRWGINVYDPEESLLDKVDDIFDFIDLYFSNLYDEPVTEEWSKVPGWANYGWGWYEVTHHINPKLTAFAISQ